MLTTPQNPILAADALQVVNLDELAGPVQFVRPVRRDVKREHLMLWRKQNAEAAMAPFGRDVEVFGLTKGQFSLLDLLVALIAHKTGPAHIELSTWTAARRDAEAIANLRRHAAALDQAAAGAEILSIRWLIDMTFLRRAPEMVATLRRVFGQDALRVAHVHAKFALLFNDSWKIVIRTSMNLNQNPRTEDYHLAHDPELFDFIHAMMTRIWALQPRSIAEARPGIISQHFKEELTLE